VRVERGGPGAEGRCRWAELPIVPGGRGLTGGLILKASRSRALVLILCCSQQAEGEVSGPSLASGRDP
jgi:hypothetical protein